MVVGRGCVEETRERREARCRKEGEDGGRAAAEARASPEPSRVHRSSLERSEGVRAGQGAGRRIGTGGGERGAAGRSEYGAATRREG